MLDHIASQIIDDIKDKAARFEQGDSFPASKLKALLAAQLRKMNLVTREEFDAQQSVLLKTRLKVEQLEQQLQALEQKVAEQGDKSA